MIQMIDKMSVKLLINTVVLLAYLQIILMGGMNLELRAM